MLWWHQQPFAGAACLSHAQPPHPLGFRNARSKRHGRKRLPSRRWNKTRSGRASSFRGRPARRSLPESWTMGRSREDDDEYDYEALYSSELGGARRKAEPRAIATRATTPIILSRRLFARREIRGWSDRWPNIRAHGATHKRIAVSQGTWAKRQPLRSKHPKTKR